MQVSVRELKDHLSEYLKKVADGEIIAITSHNKLLAKLIPFQTIEANDSLSFPIHFEGAVWNGKKPQGGTCRPDINGKTAATRIIEDRG